MPACHLWRLLQHSNIYGPKCAGFSFFQLEYWCRLRLLYFALRGVNFAEIQTRLTQNSRSWFLGWMALSVLTILVQVFLGAMRWQEISVRCQAPLIVRQAFRYNMIGTFFNQTLPSTIGGDAVRLWLVSRTGAGWRACDVFRAGGSRNWAHRAGHRRRL